MRRVVEIGVEWLRQSGQHLLVVRWKLIWLWWEAVAGSEGLKGKLVKIGSDLVDWGGELVEIGGDSMDWGWELGEIEVEGGGRMEEDSGWVGVGKGTTEDDDGWVE